MKVNDQCILKEDLPQHGLKKGQIGTIQEILPDEWGYAVEFPNVTLTLEKGWVIRV